MNNRTRVLLTPYLLKWQTLRLQATTYWQGLALKEKRLLLGCGLVLFSALTWMVMIQPALKSIDHWQAELPRLRSQAETLQALLKDVQLPTASSNLEQTLRQSLDTPELAGHYQLQAPQGPTDHWQLTFTDAPAAMAMNWLLDSGRRFSLVVIEAHLQRAVVPGGEHAPGQISGTVRMDQAPGAKESS